MSRAARELPVPGTSFGARRKYIVRAVDIDAISDAAKAAARTAKLDNKKTALMTIASERSPEAQLAKVKQLADRKPHRRGKKKTAASEPAATAETNARTPGASDTGSSIKSEIDEFEAVSKPEPDQSKPASMMVLVEFAKFILARLTQGEQIALALTTVEDVKEFNRLANRVRLVLGKESEHSSSESESNRGRSPASSELDLFKPVDEGAAPL